MPDPHASVAHALGKEVCNGNKDAEIFCTLAYQYFHAVDDWLDSREDGRPTMTTEQFMEKELCHTMMCNCRFWRQNSDLLMGALVVVHNLYANSLLWERDPKEHRRAMANVMRMAGDCMFDMVAFICGGRNHMRKVSPKLWETDYLRQNAGDPTDQF